MSALLLAFLGSLAALDAVAAISVAANQLGKVNDIEQSNELPEGTVITQHNQLKMETGPKEMIVEVGESFEISCVALGTPPPVFTWFLNGKAIVGSQDNNIYEKVRNFGKKTIETGMTTSNITIPCATKKHRGIYSCVATNGVRSVKSEAAIFVGGTGHKCLRKKNPPQIIQHTYSRFEDSGNAVQLFCRASGADQIEWFGPNHELLNNAPGYQVLENGDLIINKATADHMGPYYCVASNKFGEDVTESFFYPTLNEEEQAELLVLDEDKITDF